MMPVLIPPRVLNSRERRLFEAVGEILHYVGDPIGVAALPGARDEYDSYALQVFGLLASGASAATISAHLRRLASNEIGLSEMAGKPDEAALAVVAWREYLEEFDE